MDWGKSSFVASLPPTVEHQRRYGYADEHPWRDDTPNTRPPAGFSNGSLLMPYGPVAPSMKPGSPPIHMSMTGMQHRQQSSLDQGDFQAFSSSGMSSDYGSSAAYGPRPSPSVQAVPTLSSYFTGNHGAHPSTDYFDVLPGFSASEQDAASGLQQPQPQPPAAATSSMLDERSVDFGGDMPTEMGSFLSTHQLEQMMVTPPSTAAFARPSALSPLGLLSSRVRLSHETCFGLAAMSPTQQQQQQQYTQGAVDGLAVSADPKFTPDRRKLCCIEGCKSQARAFNRCKRHGGSKRCAHTGCTKSVQSRGLCIRHGGGSRCQEPGCARAAQSQGRCKMHGGGRPCMVPGCGKKAHLKRLCRKHGGGSKCTETDCEKWAQRQGKCMSHAKETLRARSSGSSGASADWEASAPPSSDFVAASAAERGFGDSSPDEGSFEHVHV